MQRAFLLLTLSVSITSSTFTPRLTQLMRETLDEFHDRFQRRPPARREASVFVDGDDFRVVEGIDLDADAYGFFDDLLPTTGWGVLEFRAGYGSSGVDAASVFGAAGFLEGFLTASRIQQMRSNLFNTFFGAERNEKNIKNVETFLKEQDEWTKQRIKMSDDPFWRHARYLTAQLDGLVRGYEAAMKKDRTLTKLRRFDFLTIQAFGDIGDIMNVVNPTSVPDFGNLTKDQLSDYIHGFSRCSVLIKSTSGFENLFLGHDTWMFYSMTNRIYKHYDFNTRDDDTVANALSFSSYPGCLISADDFYLMNNRLTLLQTTNPILNASLYDLVKPQSLLSWQRVRLANHLAGDGAAWFEAFRRHNSGTYNDQYMVLDLNKIELRRGIADGALWVVEQIPGLVIGRDKTEILRNGYWASYNIPFFEEIFNLSGCAWAAARHGPDFSHSLAPRGKIFRRDANKVVDMESFKTLMRSNDFLHDPYSESDPWNAICSRGDLDPRGPEPIGCYDTKAADYKMAVERRAFAINGPTRGSGLGIFEWNETFPGAFHWGTPEEYEFEFVEMKPSLK